MKGSKGVVVWEEKVKGTRRSRSEAGDGVWV